MRILLKVKTQVGVIKMDNDELTFDEMAMLCLKKTIDDYEKQHPNCKVIGVSPSKQARNIDIYNTNPLSKIDI